MTTPHRPAGSNFAFVGRVWPAILNDCRVVERDVNVNPTSSCLFARSILERVVHHIWTMRGQGSYNGMNLLEMLKGLERAGILSEAIAAKMHTIRRNGNDAAHVEKLDYSGVKVTTKHAVRSTMHLFDVLVWAVARHSTKPEFAPGPNQPFNPDLLGQVPSAGTPAVPNALIAKKLKEQALLLDEAEQRRLEEIEKHAEQEKLFAAQRAEAEREAARTKEELAEAEAKAAAIQKSLQQELEEARRKLAEAEAAKAGDEGKATAPFAISEAETRLQLIDPMLERAGFVVGQNMTYELELTGMPNNAGVGYADYVLWDDDGSPLAVVEAKRAMTDMNAGAVQVKLYADLIEQKFGKRPVMFCTDGFRIQIIDDAANLPGTGAGYPAREVEGYPNQRQLRAIIARRTNRQRLAELAPDSSIAGRTYQVEVIRAVTETFEDRRRREALLVMATGTGKTRVAIATAKLLRNANWVGKVLFLADRTSLVKQAHKNFLELYPDSAPVNLLSSPTETGDVYVSTLQTMMGMISGDGKTPPRFGPFDFDLIIVDEAHRSVYNRYKRILDYFDAYVVGLTATPRHEISHDTYKLFGIDGQEPTGEYGLAEAIEDGNLVPFKLYSQDSVILRDGVRYAELSEEEKLEWDKEDWGTDEDGNPLPPPDTIEAPGINKQLFNLTTVRNVLKTVMEHGIRVGGDQLGKTIIFARNRKHAAIIKEEFDKHFPEYSAKAASVITHGVNYVQSAIDDFSDPESGVNIAISVDMLDTGIDVPEVVNLVFFKPVYSQTKFWQMVGRGTRLRKDLFGPGMDKTHFLIFDFCDNAGMFFNEDVEEATGIRPRSLTEKLFDARVGLVRALDREGASSGFRSALASQLQGWVRDVPRDHIMVRPEDGPDLLHYSKPEAWSSLSDVDVERLQEHIAHLPLGTMGDDEDAKRFDLVLLRLQLAVIDPSDDFMKLRGRVEKVASDLHGVKDRIATVGKRLSFIERALDESWWDGVTIEDLEDLRLGLRDIVRFIPKGNRAAVVMDIEDEMGELVITEDFDDAIGPVIGVSSIEKALREVLERHQDDLVLKKLRSAKELTQQDLEELEKIVAEVGDEEVEMLRSRTNSESLPAFIRSLVGLEKKAMELMFADLMEGNTLTAPQIRFMNTIIKVLVHNGEVKVADLFGAPFDEYGQIFDIFPDPQPLIMELDKRFKRIQDSTKVSS